jgi:CheY-like chemotaxis protein
VNRQTSSTSRFLPWEIEEADSDVSDSASLFALVVEDSVVISKATSRMLSNAGYVVHVADNGADGLEKMKKMVYSIVLLNLQLPIMDGLEATRRIRSFESEASFIASGKKKQIIFGGSANVANDIRQGALASGMNLFVSKPYSMGKLNDYLANQAMEFKDFSL